MTLNLTDIDLCRGPHSILESLRIDAINRGELVVLAGPNGAGKSSLLRAISQSLPYRGQICFDGHDLATLPRAQRVEQLGYMPQTLQSQSDLSVLDSLLVAQNAAGTMRNTTTATQLQRAENCLIRLGIRHLAARPLARLSGGQRQTVGLAQAIIRNPALVLLDEPTAALDLAMQFHILNEMQSLSREGRVVIAVLHDLTQAARWADRIIVLSNGQIAADGPPATVLTPALLAQVYGVRARVERDSAGHLLVCVDGPVTPA
ncbi:hypothetical protein BFP70_01475 [Thioclava sp. SK-1]|uniref:ABC transporter ATP-binding protein n=1 Tax=Thioclava sp. SK-1 TaxID=1889770 RepID=UPI0008253C2C|nr:ABC transporter ATP-binding protein [Thioclava sp. SK-1]OCX61276.1 hypothetical protein BFP70_01475 [Thioclava sp. SK-1]